jgi:SAM-dependent methyltransferase
VCTEENPREQMEQNPSKFEDYFAHLKKISFAGRIYKKFLSSPVLYLCARRFGDRIIEIGSGTGSGVLGAFPKRVRGLEINPHAVEYCKAAGLNVQLIGADGIFPVADGACDACILDNVLEHIEDPHRTLDECYRITKENGGLVIAVPGVRGFVSDPDHKKFYDAEALRSLDERWKLQSLISIPFLFSSERLSKSVKQYCLVATYRKI